MQLRQRVDAVRPNPVQLLTRLENKYAADYADWQAEKIDSKDKAAMAGNLHLLNKRIGDLKKQIENGAVVHDIKTGEVLNPVDPAAELAEAQAAAAAKTQEARLNQGPVGKGAMSFAEERAREVAAQVPVAKAEAKAKEFNFKEDVQLVNGKIGEMVKGWMKTKGAEELSVLMTPEGVRKNLALPGGGGELPKYITNDVVQAALDDLKKSQRPSMQTAA